MTSSDEKTGRAPSAKAGPMCLVIAGEKGARTFPLPESGVITLGRSSECTICLDDSNVSRVHAAIRVGVQIEVEDRGSTNGTRIGDRELKANQRVRLSPGNVVTLGATVVVLQATGTSARPRQIRSHGYFEMHLEGECARAQASGSTFAVVRIRIEGTCPTALIEEALAAALRPMDVLAVYAPGEYEVLLVQIGRDTAEAMVRTIETRLAALVARKQTGIALFPADGRTPEELVACSGRIVHGEQTEDAADASFVQYGAMQQLEPLIKRIAVGMINVIIMGETGVGKDILAEAIHKLSPRRDKPILRLNCAALSETLLESELFGYERGAFTGAVQAKPALLETAQGGTVFFDEVGEMPLSMQAKLLRVIEERQVLRIGALKPRPIDVRFIAATNRDLEAEAEAGRFRSDLFFRLNGISLVVPPLRDRVSEIESLANVFMAEFSKRLGHKRKPRLSKDALALLNAYCWPGNIRELRNVIERAVLLCNDGVITARDLPSEKMGRTLPLVPTPAPRSETKGRASENPERSTPPAARGFKPTIPIDTDRFTFAEEVTNPETERDRIVSALDESAGNQTQAARLLGISRGTLVSRLDLYALPRPRKRG